MNYNRVENTETIQLSNHIRFIYRSKEHLLESIEGTNDEIFEQRKISDCYVDLSIIIRDNETE
ncbi:MAG: hypothetical protein EOP34_06845 [Rickettsiales bacterium]|nr:MAG: hypothetical protein EOP34_06845 [Rickettsiales bacterium]